MRFVKTGNTVKDLVEVPSANELLARIATDICLYEVENQTQPKSAKVKQLKGQLEKTWAMCQPPHADDQLAWGEACTALQHIEALLDLQQQQNEKDLGHGQELLAKMETELEQGEVHKALETRARFRQAGAGGCKTLG